jgi:hypothetical protein
LLGVSGKYCCTVAVPRSSGYGNFWPECGYDSMTVNVPFGYLAASTETKYRVMRNDSPGTGTHFPV